MVPLVQRCIVQRHDFYVASVTSARSRSEDCVSFTRKAIRRTSYLHDMLLDPIIVAVYAIPPDVAFVRYELASLQAKCKASDGKHNIDSRGYGGANDKTHDEIKGHLVQMLQAGGARSNAHLHG